jgi:TonB family protein
MATKTITDDNFDSEVLSGDRPSWSISGPNGARRARRSRRRWSRSAKKWPTRWSIAKLNIDEHPEARSRYGVMSIPDHDPVQEWRARRDQGGRRSQEPAPGVAHGAALSFALVASVALAQAAPAPPAIVQDAKVIGGHVSDRDYPPAALRQRRGGTTIVRFVVTTGGRIADCTVTRSSGHADLDAQTCVIAQRFRYRAARGAGAARFPVVHLPDIVEAGTLPQCRDAEA